ncbi:hypothetical protein CspeluHIS016_0301860 [Cutaneotrichosporon spelunceum]|uniref:PHD-type domain-containing protein n=1 Tax=Cutaneotrichosporon spelunceum TaxID=1672016 RepID=A0AAD3YAU5_9TREE|nr:hypothetical protein CspeluHIS016_0301860 [Cutaneotrichosporon spelunceum]
MPPRPPSNQSGSAPRSRATSNEEEMGVDRPDLPEPRSSRSEWGRILICGGLDWERNAQPPSSKEAGTKGVKLLDDDQPLPVKPRWMSHLKITQVIGGPLANYSIAIDLAGTAHVFGRVPFFKMENPAWRNRVHVVSCERPLHVAGPDGEKWEGGAVGDAHFLLFSSSGLYGAGDNRASPLGINGEYFAELEPIPGPWKRRKIRQVATGKTFSLVLDAAGQVYAAGKSQFGQLGNGTTGELILRNGKDGYTYQSPPQRIKELVGKAIVSIACGNNHALALDNQGRVYSWGNNQYGQLGLGDLPPVIAPMRVQPSPNDVPRVTVPTLVPLEHPATAIYAGPTSSFIITENEGNEIWVAGKCRLVGPGSSSEPYKVFEKLPDLQNVQDFSAGFISHFAMVVDEDDVPRTLAWGQGATHGELGIGSDFLSSSDPTPIEQLDNIEVLSVAAGLVHTVFLVKPDETLEERIGNAAQDQVEDEEPVKLPPGRPPGRGKGRRQKGRGGRNGRGNGWDVRSKAKEAEEEREKIKKLAIARWPAINSGDLCKICHEGEQDDLTFLECERCEEGYHMDCLSPRLYELPDGEWFCPVCEESQYEWSHPKPPTPEPEIVEDDGPGLD